MTQAAQVFTETNRERAQAASGARHRKAGSKSKKCALPSDCLTAAQMKKLNGPCKTFALNVPCTFDLLKAQGTDVQQQYLTRMIECYNVSVNRLSLMLGCDNTTLLSYANKVLSMQKLLSVRRVPTEQQKCAWDDFLLRFQWLSGYFDQEAAQKRQTAESAETKVPSAIKKFNDKYGRPASDEIPEENKLNTENAIKADTMIICHNKKQLKDALKIIKAAHMKIIIDLQY